MRRLITLSFAAVLATASIGCEPATNTSVNKAINAANSNGNLAVVVNNNSNAAANTKTMNSNSWNANISKEDYDKNKEDYATKAKNAGSTIGSGLTDGYLWAKAKGALATADDLRDSTVNVDVDNNVITLKGTVATVAQKEAAEKVAKGIEGQTGVKNELKVQAGDSMTNQMVNGNSSKATNTNANMKK